MANRYAVGTGNWTTANTGIWSATSGGATGASVPSAADEVIFDGSTGTITISASNTVACRSFTSTGTNALAFAATTSILNIGDATAGTGNVALSIGASTTITLTANGTIGLVSTSATQQTITTNGKTLCNFIISGAGSSYQFTDNLTLTSGSAALTHSAGTVDYNGKTFSMLSYVISGSTARTATYGAAAFTIARTNATPFDASTTTNLTVGSNTATFTFSAITSGTVNLGGFNWNGASFLITSTSQTGTTVVSNSATIKDFTWTGPASKTSTLSVTGDLTITGAFTWTANSDVNKTLIQSSTLGTTVTLSAASATITNSVDIKDITFAGAATWTAAGTGATYLGDAGGNSGMTFTTPATQTYAGGAGGSWSDSAKWTSRVPLPQDDVVVASGSGTLAGDMPRWGKSLNFTGYTGTLSNAGSGNTVHGSLTLASGMTSSLTNPVILEGRSTYTITSSGKSFDAVTIQAFGGTYTLQDALISTSGAVSTLNGTFDTGGYSVTANTFSSTGTATRAVTLGATTVTLTAATTTTVWNMAATGLTLSAASSTIVISTTSANTRTFTGSTFNYGTLTYTVAGSTGILSLSAQYIDTLNFSDVTNARTLQFTAGTVTAVKNFNVQGTSGKLMTVKSITGGSPAYLDLVGGYDTVDYLSIQDITSVIPYKFYAGVNSTDVSGNLNIIFAAAPTSGQYINFVAEVGSSGGSATVTFPYGLSPNSGDMIHLARSFSSSPGTVNAITGYTASGASIANVVYGYYRVSDGTETSITSTVTGSPSTHNLKVMVIGGFTGTATLDVTDSNSSAAATSLNTTATTGPTNTDAVAIVVANFQGVGSLGASVSTTNSYQWQRYGTETSTYRMLAKRVTSSAANSTTYTWTTSRTPGAILTVYKDVSGSTNYTRNDADTITLSDAAIKAIAKPLSDTITLSDSIVRAITSAKADTITLSDASSRAIGLSKADTFTLSDAMVSAIGKLPADTVTMSDMAALVATYIRSAADTLTLSDSATTGGSQTYLQTAADILTLTDHVSYDFSGQTNWYERNGSNWYSQNSDNWYQRN